jgi:hypothetical protein
MNFLRLQQIYTVIQALGLSLFAGCRPFKMHLGITKGVNWERTRKERSEKTSYRFSDCTVRFCLWNNITHGLSWEMRITTELVYASLHHRVLGESCLLCPSLIQKALDRRCIHGRHAKTERPASLPVLKRRHTNHIDENSYVECMFVSIWISTAKGEAALPMTPEFLFQGYFVKWVCLNHRLAHGNFIQAPVFWMLTPNLILIKQKRRNWQPHSPLPIFLPTLLRHRSNPVE